MKTILRDGMRLEVAYDSVIPTKVLLDVGLSPISRLVYGLMSSMRTVDGVCRATNRELSQLLGISERSVGNSVRMLSRAKYVKVIYSRGGKRGTTKNVTISV